MAVFAWALMLCVSALAGWAVDAWGQTIHYAQQGGPVVPTPAAAGARFGDAVALSADGNTALVGAPGTGGVGSPGTAWIYTRSGSTWSEQALLTPMDETGSGEFGLSVALSSDGNTALVGGPADSSAAGAAWVFVRSGSTWTQQGPKLQPGDESGPGGFGVSVALSGNGTTALIGGSDDSSAAGAAWAYVRAGTTWSPQSKLTAGSDASGTPDFGSGVALSSDGNTALVGGFEDAGAVGAAWAFTRSGTTWSHQGSKLAAGDETGRGGFGNHLSLSGDGNTAVIAAPFDDSNLGAAWIFTRSGASWSQQGSKLHPSDSGGQPQFGTGVGISADGSTALIGGPYHATAGEQGAAWVFTRTTGTWTQDGSRLLQTGASGQTWFGTSTALSSDATTALIGGPYTSSIVGAAWVFSGSAACGQLCNVQRIRTIITSGPSGLTDQTPLFTFASNIKNATFQCHMDSGPWGTCTSPYEAFLLPYGKHTFHVRAVAPDGTVDQIGDSRSFDLEPQTKTFTCSVDAANAVFAPGAVVGEIDCFLHGACPARATCSIPHASISTTDLRKIGTGWIDLSACTGAVPGGLKNCLVIDPPQQVVSTMCYFPFVLGIGTVCPLEYDNPNARYQGSIPGFGADCKLIQEQKFGDVQGTGTCTVDMEIVPAQLLVPGGGAGGVVNVFAPGAGKLGLNPVGGPAADLARARPSAFAPVHVRVRREGWVRLRLKLSRHTQVLLRRRHKLTLSVRLTFTPRTGREVVRTKRFTLVLPKCVIFKPSRKRMHGHIVPVPHPCTVKL